MNTPLLRLRKNVAQLHVYANQVQWASSVSVSCVFQFSVPTLSVCALKEGK